MQTVFAYLCACISILICTGCGTTATTAHHKNQDINTKALYASPDGIPANAGNMASPLDLYTAITRVPAGGWVYLRGGTYNLQSTLRIEHSGLEKKRTFLVAYQNEQPVLNFSQQPRGAKHKGILLNANYWQLERLTIEHAGDNGVYISGSHNILANLVTRYNADTGLQIGRTGNAKSMSKWPSFNRIIDCESHDNRDANGENADGFAAKLTVGPGNVFKGCVAHHNADDGWDLYTKKTTGPIGAVTIESSVAYRNGYLSDGSQTANGDGNGFKLGGDDIPVPHRIINSQAIENRRHGFTNNRNPGEIVMQGNIAADNNGRNFNVTDGQAQLIGNLSCRQYLHATNADLILPYRETENRWWTGKTEGQCQNTP